MHDEYKDLIENKTNSENIATESSNTQINQQVGVFYAAMEQLGQNISNSDILFPMLTDVFNSLQTKDAGYGEAFISMNGPNMFIDLFEMYPEIASETVPKILEKLLDYTVEDPYNSKFSKTLAISPLFPIFNNLLNENLRNTSVLRVVLYFLYITDDVQDFYQLFPFQRLFFVSVDSNALLDEFKDDFLPCMKIAVQYIKKINLIPEESVLSSLASHINFIAENTPITMFFNNEFCDFLILVYNIMLKNDNFIINLSQSFYNQVTNLLVPECTPLNHIILKIIRLIYIADKKHDRSNRTFSIAIFSQINYSVIAESLETENQEYFELIVQVLKFCIVLNPSIVYSETEFIEFLIEKLQNLFLTAQYQQKRPLILLIQKIVALTSNMWRLLTDEFLEQLISMIEESSADVIPALNIIHNLLAKSMFSDEKDETIQRLLDLQLSVALDDLITDETDERTVAIAENIESLLNTEEEEI